MKQAEPHPGQRSVFRPREWAPPLAPANGGPRVVKLNRREQVLFDLAGPNYRVSYWRPPREDEPAGKQLRFSHASPDLQVALATVFLRGGAEHDPRTVEEYMRSTEWGQGLP